MVHERDEKYESHEDGEYHFSDDQANYEIEMDEVDHTTAAKPAAATGATAASPARTIEQYKRPIIGVVVFITLVFLVYKITAPTGSSAPGDLSQAPAGAPSQKITKITKPMLAQNTAVKQNTAFQPLAQAPGMSSNTPAGVNVPVPATAPAPVPIPAPVVLAAPTESAPPPSIPVSAPTVVAQTPAPAVKPALVATTPATAPETAASAPVAQAQPAPAVVIQPEPLYNPMHPTLEPNSIAGEATEVAALNQKVANLTQENARLEADYAQKMSDLESENTTLQNKLQDVNSHLTNLETTIAHLKVQQEPRMPSHHAAGAAAGLMPSSASLPAMPVASEPKSVYTVQAIIPGRAWLKSENGETLTVAEGDTLRGYGRIIKIDPYDGVVELDVGGRIMSLSYGSSSE